MTIFYLWIEYQSM